MCRNRLGIMACAMLLLTGCAGSDASKEQEETKSDLMLEVLEQGADEGAGSAYMRTGQIAVEDIVTDYSDIAHIYIPFQEDVCYEQELAQIVFQEYLVEAGSYVKKGDPLVRLSVSADEIDREELQLAVERGREEYQKECRKREEAIAQAQEEVSTAGEGYGQQKAQLVCQQLVNAYAQYQEEEEARLEEMQARLEEYQSIFEQEEVIIEAKKDGYVSDFEWVMAGMQISSGECLMHLSDTSVFYYEVDDPIGELRYGMEVTMSQNAIAGAEGAWDGVMTGTVICADNVLDKMKSSKALIQIETMDGEPLPDTMTAEKMPQSIRAVVHPVSIRQVPVMPEEGLVKDESFQYAVLLENGVRRKAYLVSPVAVNKKYWVIYGAKDGDTYLVK